MACFTVRFSRITMQFVVIFCFRSHPHQRSGSFRYLSAPVHPEAGSEACVFLYRSVFKTSARASVSILKEWLPLFYIHLFQILYSFFLPPDIQKHLPAYCFPGYGIVCCAPQCLILLILPPDRFRGNCSLSLKTAGETLASGSDSEYLFEKSLISFCHFLILLT